jgi:hypothetical protein
LDAHTTFLARADAYAPLGAYAASFRDADPTTRFHCPASFHADTASLFHPHSSAFHIDAPAALHADAVAFIDADAVALAELAADAPAVPPSRPAPAVADTQAIAAAVKARPAPSIIVPAVLGAGPSVLDVINHGLLPGRSPNSVWGNHCRSGSSDRHGADQQSCRQDR